jgi:uncharacterized membrane protein
MAGFPIGMILLLIISILIYLGLAQRILDRLGLTDRIALGFIAAIIIGSFINIPIATARVEVSINVGGALIPIGLAIYVLSRAGTLWEKARALLAAVVAATAIFFINTQLFPADPWHGGLDFIDPLYVYPIVAGGIAYLISRSRRGSFVAATLGVIFLDLYDIAVLFARGGPGNIAIGGAGVLDAVVLSGVFAVLLAELVGETRERIQGGPIDAGHHPKLLQNLKRLQGHDVTSQPARKDVPNETTGENFTSKRERQGED